MRWETSPPCCIKYTDTLFHTKRRWVRSHCYSVIKPQTSSTQLEIISSPPYCEYSPVFDLISLRRVSNYHRFPGGESYSFPRATVIWSAHPRFHPSRYISSYSFGFALSVTVRILHVWILNIEKNSGPLMPRKDQSIKTHHLKLIPSLTELEYIPISITMMTSSALW